MKKIIMILFFLVSVCFLNNFSASAAETGIKEATEIDTDIFEIEGLPGITFNILPGEKNPSVIAMVDLECGDFYDTYGPEIIIPEKIRCNGNEYLVTEIGSEYSHIDFLNISKLDIPASVKKINTKCIIAEGDGPVSMVFRCDISAFESVEWISLDEGALESIVYCPQDSLKEYQKMIKKRSKVTFYDTEDMSRSYCGLRVAPIGETDAIPLAFWFNGGCYKILSDKGRTVSLIRADYKTSKLEGLYEQPETVYYHNEPYTVTKIDYFAYHLSECSIKLPASVKAIASGCFGQFVKSVDMSETKVKTINSYLFLSYSDNITADPVVSEIVLPRECKKIKKKAFYNCKQLKSITIPENVEKVGYKALNKKCKSYYILGDRLPSGIEMQYMKRATFFVKEGVLDEANKVLGSKIKLGKCKVKLLSDGTY